MSKQTRKKTIIVKSECCVPSGFISSGNLSGDLSLLCKALGHPVRVQIVQMLLKDGSCISGDLSGAIDLAPSTVSEHLRILKEAGFVQGTIEGTRRCYCINNELLLYVQKLFSDLVLQKN